MNESSTPALTKAYTKGQILETTVDDLGEADTCFSRLPEGLGVFIRGQVAVGDRVRAEVTKVKKKYLEARLQAVLEPSPHRVEPACAHFGVCGGCKWQHVSYPEQLRLKRKRIEDVLSHIGGFDGVHCEPVVPASSPYRYRNKIEFSFSQRRFLLESERAEGAAAPQKPGNFALGFHAPRFFEKVVDIDECHLVPQDMNLVLNAVRGFALARELSVYSTRTHQGFLRNLVLRHARASGELMVNLVTSSHEEGLMAEVAGVLEEALGGRLTTFVNSVTTRKNTSAIGEREFVVQGPGFITEQSGGCRFRISAGSFFQTNSEQADQLYAAVRGAAGLESGHIVYDLYSGIGVMAIILAGLCSKMLGVEIIDSAVADARANAELNGIDNCAFMKLDMKDIKKATGELESFGLPDVVIVDPPRAGVHPKALETLLHLNPLRVVYVSCNPASMARDAAVLCESGRYRLENVVPVDMFPHTNHIESVARLERV